MDEPDFDAEDYSNNPDTFRDPEEIDWTEIVNALKSLTLFGSNHFLGMQAYSLAVVDKFLMPLEGKLLATQVSDDRTDMELAMFLSAQSQMWIFAVYELMRTWRQRAKDVLKLHAYGGLELKAKALEEDKGYLHPAREARARELREVLANPSLIERIKEDLRHSHITFHRLEFIRVALAKHEVSGRAGSLAHAPGYGRINRECGSLAYEMSNGRVVLGTISRRDIADEIRALSDRTSIPADDELKDFDAFMNLSENAIPF